MPNLMETTPEQIAQQLQVSLIAAQNDLFRKGLIDPDAALEAYQGGIHGKFLLTNGVSAEGEGFSSAALHAVGAFDAFTGDNDPYHDHTFGAFAVQGEKLFWKIDLFDANYEYGSNTPHDPKVTRRVLTIMLVNEY